MSRCKQGTYTEKKQGQILLQVRSKLPCPRHFPALLSGLSLPRAQGFPNSLTPGKPAQDWEKYRKPHPGAQHLVPEEKVPVVSPNLVPRQVRGSRRSDSDLGGVLGGGGGQEHPQCHFLPMPPCPLTRVGVTPDGTPRHSPAIERLRSGGVGQTSCPGAHSSPQPSLHSAR